MMDDEDKIDVPLDKKVQELPKDDKPNYKSNKIKLKSKDFQEKKRKHNQQERPQKVPKLGAFNVERKHKKFQEEQ